MRTLAQHTLLEFHHCLPARLMRARVVRAFLRKAVLAGGGTIVEELFHNFSPYGVSGVVVITESHVAVHTWPEHAYAAVDIFSCSDKLDHAAIRDSIRASLASRRVEARTFARGPRKKPGLGGGKPAPGVKSRSR